MRLSLALATTLAPATVAFSPQRRTPSYIAPGGRGILLPADTIRFASVATEDQKLELDEKKHQPTDATNKNLSELEQFVVDCKELYSDLENGGGSVRREMSGVSFTYVAPANQFTTPNASPEQNRQLYGAWRLQKPEIYGAEEDLTAMHRRIYEERMETKSLDFSKPPPLLIYLPGLDGFGISATAQLDDLSSTFELWRMSVDKGNLQLSFSDLVNRVVKFVKDATSSAEFIESPREVIIVGESFGGLLTCAVGMALTKVQSKKFTLKGMTLVNPATSFDETAWEQIVPVLTSLSYLESQEEITDDSGNFRLSLPQGLPTPYSVVGGLALAAVIPDSTQYNSILDFILKSVMKDMSNESALAASSDGFRILAEYLPATTLQHRCLKWLPVGTSVVNSPQRLAKLDVPTLIIGGNDDNLLPSKEEADRLGKLLPDSVKMDISGSGHFVLDTRVNLTEVLIDSHIDPFDTKKTYDPVMDWKLPPDDVVNTVIQKRIMPQRERISPVFFSTDPVSGKRRLGLSHVPLTEKPILFVGNHQLFGQDLGLVLSELLEERDIIARGLAHPVAMGENGGFGNGGAEGGTVRKQKRRHEFDEDSQDPTDLFKMFGAVKVSPRNFYRLLQTNQNVLLFPGGVKEALHGKGEEYKVFWPEKTDFVRIAAKFNATIVPLSAIGAADSANIVLDKHELLNLPFGLGDNLANFTSSTASARFGEKNEDELFVPPLAVPKPFLARHYFLFGKAYDTSALDPKDEDACRDVYKAIEEKVKYDIDALLEARKDDPFALDGIQRMSYQRLFRKDPPTFPLESLRRSPQ